ncbi:MAG: hypothetical protein RIT14_995 [Pseudomonadota bacterium]
MRRYLIPAIAGAATLALLIWAFAPRAIEVETATVTRSDLAVDIEVEGVARIREVFVVSAPIAGRLQRIALHPGDEVTAGDSVARIGPAAPALLDSRSRAVAEATVAAAGAAVDLARAQLAQAEAAQEFAASEAARSRALFDRATLSRRVLENAILAERTAVSAVASARANLAVRERELESASAVLADGDATGAEACCIDIVTPVSGRILRVATEDEQVVQPGVPILEIGNSDNLQVEVDLLSRDAVRVTAGAEATITGWGGPDLPARVERIEPAAVTKVSALGIEEQRVSVILSLAGSTADRQALGHGFRVLARIRVWEGRDIPVIPVGALFRDGADWACFVLAQGRADLRRIRIGQRNEDVAQVLDGLREGETVVLHPSDAVAAGVRLRSLGP